MPIAKAIQTKRKTHSISIAKIWMNVCTLHIEQWHNKRRKSQNQHSTIIIEYLFKFRIYCYTWTVNGIFKMFLKWNDIWFWIFIFRFCVFLRSLCHKPNRYESTIRLSATVHLYSVHIHLSFCNLFRKIPKSISLPNWVISINLWVCIFRNIQAFPNIRNSDCANIVKWKCKITIAFVQRCPLRPIFARIENGSENAGG